MIVILVVSGEERISRHVRRVLGSQGWWVTSASDREEALRASADQEPALVVVDCEVEGAAELVRTFGSKNGGPGVLLLEPPGDTESAFLAFEVGADQILSNPPQAKPLLEAAERVMSLPHQSAGALAAEMGEKLSSAEIFGDVLVELGAAELETAAPPETSLGEPEPEAKTEPEPEFEPSEKVPIESGQASGAELSQEDSAAAEDVMMSGPEESQAGTASELVEESSSFGVREEEVREEVGLTATGEETGDPTARLAGSLEAMGEEMATVPPGLDLAREEGLESIEALEASDVTKEHIDFSAPDLPPEQTLEAEVEAAEESFAETRPDGAEITEETEISAVLPATRSGEAPEMVPPSAGTPGPGDEATAGSEASSAQEIVPSTDQGGVSQSFEAKLEPIEPVEPAHHEVSQREEPVEGEEGRFGQYRLDDRIAVGGMAEVWRASMLGMEGFRKTVAIKKILPHLAENGEFVAMFIEEAKLAAQLSHENLVDIYDLGKIDESFFIAMEYVDGKDLRALLNRLRESSEQMPIDLALLVAGEVARGLEYAHTRADSEGSALGLVHRDVSPRNVLIGYDGRVRLCDFGVAKAVSSVIQTEIGALKGKLQYMSPEQASGKPVDHRSDIYSLGSVMYEMISGRRLYEADNEISLLEAVRVGNFEDPRKHRQELPHEVGRILIKALAKKPSARYQSAGDLEQDLRAILRAQEPVPGEQNLSAWVGELLAQPVQAQDQPLGEGEAAPSSAGSDGPEAVTQSLQILQPAAVGRVARFWWGVAAGLLAAGLVAILLKLFLG